MTESQIKNECHDVPERKCRTLTDTVVDTVVETQHKEQCQTSFETECQSILVTKVKEVPGKYD